MQQLNVSARILRCADGGLLNSVDSGGTFCWSRYTEPAIWNAALPAVRFRQRLTSFVSPAVRQVLGYRKTDSEKAARTLIASSRPLTMSNNNNNNEDDDAESVSRCRKSTHSV